MNVVPHYLFDVWADSWRRVYNLVHQKLIQYGCLARIVETDDDDLVLCAIKKKNNVRLGTADNWAGDFIDVFTFGAEVTPDFRKQEPHGRVGG